MNTEFETVAWMHGKQIPVTICFDVDGYKPIGLWVIDADNRDVTCEIDGPEYDLLYQKACTHVAESMMEAAEMAADMER